MTRILPALLACSLTSAALAEGYPVSGRFGESTGAQQGPIDCSKTRVVDFKGDQRTDTGGGVPAYRNDTVTTAGPNNYRVTDVFTNGQVNNAQVNYTLRKIDTDKIELQMQSGGTLKLQRCK